MGTESGKRSDRPKLAAALSHAKAIGATLVFAKLNRLTRNVDLLRTLVVSGVDLVFCDLPHVPPGAMGCFLLTQMASVAELEAGLASVIVATSGVSRTTFSTLASSTVSLDKCSSAATCAAVI